MKILFLVSSSGLSHLARSLELARYLRNEGIDVIFGCGDGIWKNITIAYGFKSRQLFEIKFIGSAKFGIKSFNAEDLIQAYKSELKLIKSIRPDIIISDWRMTAKLSSEAAKIPCIQIWNSNWGLLAGYTSLVNPNFVFQYNQIISSWMKEFEIFFKKMRLNEYYNEFYPFRGDLNIIPDHTIFRNLTTIINKQFKLVGPLVPWPSNINEIFDSNKSQVTNDVIIAFGGHSLSNLQKKIMGILYSKGLKVAVLNKSFNGLTNNSKNFSFFPTNLLSGKVIITHGGIGTIYQSLLVAKPLLVIPQHLEHLDNALCVENLGVGISLLPNKINQKNLFNAYEELFDQSILNKVNQLSQVLMKSNPLASAYSVIKEKFYDE